MKKLVVLGELRIFLAFSFRMYDSVHPFHDKFNKDTPVQDYLVMFIFSLNSKREQKSKNLLGLEFRRASLPVPRSYRPRE